MKKAFNIFLFLGILALMIAPCLVHAVSQPLLGLPTAATGTDSMYFMVRKVSPDSVARKYPYGAIRDTARKIAQDSARKIAQDTAKKVVHDSLTVRVPQAIDTAASPRFHTLTTAYFATGSTTALLGTTNCPAHTGTAPNRWLGLIFINGDTLWVPGWK